MKIKDMIPWKETADFALALIDGPLLRLGLTMIMRTIRRQRERMADKQREEEAAPEPKDQPTRPLAARPIPPGVIGPLTGGGR